jgi:hypothetical protein
MTRAGLPPIASRRMLIAEASFNSLSSSSHPVDSAMLGSVPSASLREITRETLNFELCGINLRLRHFSSRVMAARRASASVFPKTRISTGT